MFIEFSEPRDWSQYSTVIVGSGFAGQFLAEKLSKSGRVLLLEAGGRNDPLALGNGYYEIASTGIEYPTLGSRLSAFGGSSNHWTGQTHPLSPAIFSDRPGIPGWPIRYEDYAFHLPEALTWLGLPPQPASAAASSLAQGLFKDHQDLRVLQFQTPNPPPLLGNADTQRRYAKSKEIDVLIDTRLVDMHLAAGGTSIASIDLIHGASRHRRSIPVQTLILCAGGVENPRLLLWAGRKYSSGNPLLGGPNHLTGKYLTEHPVYNPVEIYFDSRVNLADANLHPHGNTLEHSVWLPSDDFLERHGLLRMGTLFHDPWQVAADDPEVADLDPEFLAATPLLTAARPIFKFEQTPHEASRITLLETLDRDGVAGVNLHWAILRSDFDKFRKATILMCGLLTQKGFARVRLRPGYENEDWSGIMPWRSAHHMGATRMGATAQTGVIDRNCRVFGVDNLYVAGSSVFPHGDWLNPTLNFLALAARLGYFLQARSRPEYAYFRYGLGRNENSQLISGWSYPEELGIWTDADQAVLRLPRSGAKHLTIYGHAFRKSDVRLSINGIERYCGPAAALMRKSFELDNSPDVEVIFTFPHLRSPKDDGESIDERTLGFFLERIEMR
jgi:choline dehydrogenase-like flavoprotein